MIRTFKKEASLFFHINGTKELRPPSSSGYCISNGFFSPANCKRDCSVYWPNFARGEEKKKKRISATKLWVANFYYHKLYPNCMGGGQVEPCDAKLSDNCPCSHNTAFKP